MMLRLGKAAAAAAYNISGKLDQQPGTRFARDVRCLGHGRAGGWEREGDREGVTMLLRETLTESSRHQPGDLSGEYVGVL